MQVLSYVHVSHDGTWDSGLSGKFLLATAAPLPYTRRGGDETIDADACGWKQNDNDGDALAEGWRR